MGVGDTDRMEEGWACGRGEGRMNPGALVGAAGAVAGVQAGRNWFAYAGAAELGGAEPEDVAHAVVAVDVDERARRIAAFSASSSLTRASRVAIFSARRARNAR